MAFIQRLSQGEPYRAYTNSHCLFLLNYLSFKKMETRICQEQIFIQGKKKSVQTPFQCGFIYIYTYIYKYFLCIMTNLGV